MRATTYLLISGLGGGAVAAAIAAMPSMEPHRHAPALSVDDPIILNAAPAAPADPRAQLARALSGHRTPVPPERAVELIERGLASTGASAEPWTHDAERAFAGLRRGLPGAMPGDPLRMTSPRCFAAGCIVTIEYPPEADAAALADALLDAPALTDWPGGKLVSPTVLGSAGAPDARHTQAQRWVLLRPDAL